MINYYQEIEIILIYNDLYQLDGGNMVRPHGDQSQYIRSMADTLTNGWANML